MRRPAHLEIDYLDIRVGDAVVRIHEFPARDGLAYMEALSNVRDGVRRIEDVLAIALRIESATLEAHMEPADLVALASKINRLNRYQEEGASTASPSSKDGGKLSWEEACDEVAARYNFRDPIEVWTTLPFRHITRFYYYAVRSRERERCDLFSCFAKMDRPKWLDEDPDEAEERRKKSEAEYAAMKERFTDIRSRK